MSFDETYKDKVINGSTFPGSAYKLYTVKLNPEIVNEYIPEIKKLGIRKGMELLLTIMAFREGFKKGTRSYVNNNPGNIGNTDSGANKKLPTLQDGICLQINYISDIIEGKHKAYPLGKEVNIKPYYSPEIAKNSALYGMSPYLPGYKFVFTGQIDQFVKIYSTGARGGNNYINAIVSYFKQNGFTIKPDAKLQDIVNL
jgi:hypothetical protein